MKFILFLLIVLTFSISSQDDQASLLLHKLLDSQLASRCVSNIKLVTAYAKALKQNNITTSSPKQLKRFIDLGLKSYTKHKTFRTWDTYDNPEHQICRDDPWLYQPLINTSRIETNMGNILERYKYILPLLSHKSIDRLLAVLPIQLRFQLKISRFTIIENQLFTDHYLPQFSDNNYEKYLVPQLKNLPDMDFVIFMKEIISKRDLEQFLQKQNLSSQEFDSKLELYKRIIIELPAFMMSKDLYSEYQFNKLLIPDIQKLSEVWKVNIKNLEQGIERYPWDSKIQKVFWRGNVSGFQNDDVDIFSNIPQYFPRANLVKMSQNHKDMIDAQFTGDLQPYQEMLKKLDIQVDMKTKDEFPLKQQLKYKYLIIVDGKFFDRVNLPLIMHSNSVLLRPENGKISWNFQMMVPNVHYVAINHTLQNLLDKIDYLRKNDQVLRQIVGNANLFFNKTLRPDSVTREMINILRNYASYQNFTPDYLTWNLYKTFNRTKIQDRIHWHYRIEVVKNILIGVFVIICLILLALKINKEEKQMKNVKINQNNFIQIDEISINQLAATKQQK